MMKGSCLCGTVQFQLEGPPLFISYCHCTLCQKASGSVLLAVLHSGARGFEWTRGEDKLKAFESSPGNKRLFCKDCGSLMPVIRDAHITIPTGSLDSDPGVKPVVHVYCSSRPNWQQLADDLPNYEALPPESFWNNPA